MNENWLLALQETSVHSKADQALNGLLHVMGISALAVGTVASMAGLLALVLAIAPNVTYRAANAMRLRGFVSFLAGAGATIVLVLAAAVTAKAEPLNVVVAAVATVAAILALGATSEVLGRKLAVIAGRDTSRVSQLMWGWLTFAFASGVPVLGWFVILPYGIVAGMGAVILGFFIKEEA